MPNNITNRVTISSPLIFEEWLCLRSVTNSDGEFDLDKLIPMPASLHLEPDFGDEEIAKSGSPKTPHNAEHVAIMRSNLKEHGYTTWYDWCCDKWGTKWNSYTHANEPGELVDGDALRVLADGLLADGEDYAEEFALAVHRGEVRRPGTLVFDTAWATPRPIFAALAKQFPAVLIVVEYADEDIGSNCGTLTYEGGELVSAVSPDKADAAAFAYRVTGLPPDEERPDDGGITYPGH